jgi:hypothetical protein
MEWTAFGLAFCALILGLIAPTVIHLLSAGKPF